MRKQNVGERKRTVTLTIGPKTEKLLVDYLNSLIRRSGGIQWTLTDLVAMLLRRGIEGNEELCGGKKGMPWISERV